MIIFFAPSLYKEYYVLYIAVTSTSKPQPHSELPTPESGIHFSFDQESYLDESEDSCEERYISIIKTLNPWCDILL